MIGSICRLCCSTAFLSFGGVKARARDTLVFARSGPWDKEVRSLWHRPGTKKGRTNPGATEITPGAALRQHHHEQ